MGTVRREPWVTRFHVLEPKGQFCRAAGREAALLDKAAAIGQRWLRGMGITRALPRLTRATVCLGATGTWGACSSSLKRGKQIRWDD